MPSDAVYPSILNFTKMTFNYQKVDRYTFFEENCQYNVPRKRLTRKKVISCNFQKVILFFCCWFGTERFEHPTLRLIYWKNEKLKLMKYGINT